MLSLCWFRRDLRVTDHPALTRAAALGAVLPVWICEPSLWAAPTASARHWAFLEESLRGFGADLAAAGQPLLIRAGDAVEVLARLQAKHKVARIVTHAETGSLPERARFDRVCDWARSRGLEVQVLPEAVAAPLPAPLLEPVAEGTGAMPGPKALGLAEDRCPYRQPGGRAAGLQMLETWLSGRGQGHAPARATATAAERGGSRLSPYLALGLLSVAEIRAAMAEARGRPGWSGALRAMTQQLARREAARAAVLVEPAGEGGETGAWGRAETGLPYVDAALRALAATGWLDARSRALVAAVGVHHLRLDAAAVGQHLARLSTDHDPAIHGREMARLASGPIPDPVALGLQLDPAGAFLRRWLPELARVPDAHLHAPWRWPRARRVLAGRYPEPVADPASAARAARAIRARAGMPPGPVPLSRRTPPGAQMALDL